MATPQTIESVAAGIYKTGECAAEEAAMPGHDKNLADHLLAGAG